MRTPDYDLRRKVIEFSQNPDAVRALFEAQDKQRDRDYQAAKEAFEANDVPLHAGCAEWIKETIRRGEHGTMQGKRASAKANASLYEDKPYLFCPYSKKAFGGALTIAACDKWMVDEKINYPAAFFDKWGSAYRSILHLSNQEIIKKSLEALLQETLSTEE